MTGPSLLLVLPFAILLIGLDAVCGRAPLQLGRPAIVTVQCSRSPEAGLLKAQLNAPAGIQVETAPVRIPAMSQISWRVRPIQFVSGELRIRYDGRVIVKSISAIPGLQWLSDSRAGSAAAFLLYPFELPFSSSVVNSVSVRYPRATVFNLNWVVWFSMASLAGALVYALAAHRR